MMAGPPTCSGSPAPTADGAALFIPLYDGNKLRHIGFHYVTVGLILANTAVFLLQQLTGTVYDVGFALIPAALDGYGMRSAEIAIVPDTVTLLTYAFFHADFWHLASNMLFLWVFGDNVEDAVGHWRFLLFYLLCAIGAGLSHSLMQPMSTEPLIGASGAVAGVIGAYLMLHPRVWVWVLVLYRFPVPVPAVLLLGFWILLQVWNALVAGASGSGVAWMAHIGGFLSGVILILVLRRRGVPLFDRRPDAAE